MIRAVVDINVIISAIIVPRGFSFDIWSAWRNDKFILVTSVGILTELTGKLVLPKITRYGIGRSDVAFTIKLLQTQAKLISVVPEKIMTVTDDPEDNLVLATAHLGKSDYLVTGDKKLLEMKQYKKVKIISPREFVNQFGGK